MFYFSTGIRGKVRDVSHIYHVTGNPFVDAGIMALCALSGKDDPLKLGLSDLKKHARELPRLYLRWKLGVLFTQNSKFSNPAVPSKDRERRYADYLNDLLQQVRPASQSGSCMACGSRLADTERIFREIHPLTGSGDFLNYFSFFEGGLPICAACVLALQFIPFYLISKKGGRLILVHSHNTRLMLNLAARRTVPYIKGLIAASGELAFYAPKDYLGREDQEFLVNLVYKVILPLGELYGPTAIRMYALRNSGQRNELDCLDLPAQVFKFMEEAYTGNLRQSLQELFERSSPEMYRRLVAGESIQHFFIQKKVRRIIGGWELFELYLTGVEEMKQARLDAIKKVGQRLYDYLKKTGFKRLDALEDDNLDYRSFLVELNKIQREALVWKIDEFALLFPEDEEGRILWKETRNILLGYIYELKHEDKEVKKS
jgi:CRISPR-associated protein Cst1